MPAVEAEGDPAGLIAERDARDLLRRHHRRVEDVQPAVGAVRQPQLLLVRASAPMPWLGQPWRLTGPLAKPVHLDAVQHLAGAQVADLESEQVVDVDEAQRLRGVDRERSDGRCRTGRRSQRPCAGRGSAIDRSGEWSPAR